MTPPEARDGASFGRRDRLLEPGEFETVRKRGAQARGAFLIVYESPGERGRTRLGMAVPRGVGNAVTRNRVKRFIREAFRTGRQSLCPCCDMLVVARPAAAGAKAADIAGELRTLDARLSRGGARNG
ncbi:MAG: ribonuclease P protein component [Deltaproteobacteria bacterium]|nr:ribonuclease P protein component [Deltaproteobacteria bacterium]